MTSGIVTYKLNTIIQHILFLVNLTLDYDVIIIKVLVCTEIYRKLPKLTGKKNVLII